MQVQWERVELERILPWRELYRQAMHAQIVHDSWCGRRKTDGYLAKVGGQLAGYGLVDVREAPATLYEYYLFPGYRQAALRLFRGLVEASAAARIRAQSNDRLLSVMLHDCATNIDVEAVLFADHATTALPCPRGARFRSLAEDERPHVFQHHREPVGQWAIQASGTVVATGGAYDHYNPPYSDVFMEVAEPERGKGYGAYLVQEVKRTSYERGKRPGARCAPDNAASRRTLEKAGFLVCGHVLSGEVRSESVSP